MSKVESEVNVQVTFRWFEDALVFLGYPERYQFDVDDWHDALTCNELKNCCHFLITSRPRLSGIDDRR